MRKNLYSILFSCAALQLQTVYPQEEGNEKKQPDKEYRPRRTTLPSHSAIVTRKNEPLQAALFHSQPLIISNEAKPLSQEQLLRWEVKRIAVINQNHLQKNPALPEELKNKRKSDIQSLTIIAQAPNPRDKVRKTKLFSTRIRPQGIKFEPKTESK